MSRHHFRSASLVLLILPPLAQIMLSPPPAVADGPRCSFARCGTYPGKLQETLARHRYATKLHRSPGKIPRSAPAVTQVGQSAVIEDDGTLILPPRPFDLSGQSLQFLRRPKGMSVVRSKLGVKARRRKARAGR